MSLATVLGTAHPLVQAPLAGVQDERLALAASAAGALGSLPAAMLSAEQLHSKLQALQASGLPYSVNFFSHTPPAPNPAQDAAWQQALQPYYAELGLDATQPPAGGGRRPFDAQAAEVLQGFAPRMVSFHFGLPAPDLLATVKACGALVASSATTVREALWLQQNGADVVIAQGLEAGGHRGHFLDCDPALQASTWDLLPAVRAQVSLPVIAAGGISDAHDVARAMALGADAVQVGTAFMLCDEALTSPLHRQRLRDAGAPTALTNLFSGGLARGLFNRAMQELGPVSALAPAFPQAAQAITPLRAKAEALGRDDFTPLWSGAKRSGCLQGPAKDVVAALAQGFAR